MVNNPQLAYISLSSLNRNVNTSRGNEGIIYPHDKKYHRLDPFVTLDKNYQEDLNFSNTKGEDIKNEQKEVSNSTAMKLSAKKQLLLERIKEIEDLYKDIEGAKAFSKCFLTAMRSTEESISDIEYQYAFVKLLISLHGNWRSFLDSVRNEFQQLKNDKEKMIKEIRELNVAHIIEKKRWEEEQLKEKQRLQAKPLAMQFNTLKEKYNHASAVMEAEKKGLTNQISVLTNHNNNLKEELKKIKENTDVIRTAKVIQDLNDNLHHAHTMLKNEREDKSNIGFKLHTLLEATKQDIKERDNILLEKAKEHDELLALYNKTKNELEEYRAFVKETHERMCMCQEDILQSRLRAKRLRKQIGEKQEVIERLYDNVKDLELQLKLERERLVQNKEVTIDGTLFYFVWKDSIAQSNNNTLLNSRASHTENAPVENSNEANKTDSMMLENYTYLKPTYRSLLGNLLPSEELSKVSYQPAFPLWLQVTIRAIFDSKMSEILLSYNKGKRISRFPEFVHSWLGRFYVDKESRSPKLLEYTEKDAISRKNRCDLLLGLELASSGKLWEVNVFREFLEEKLGLDELVYFLHCRFILFKGSQLAIPTAGFCVTHFVTKERVYDTIDRLMHTYSTDAKKELKDKFLTFASKNYKDPNAFDYAMVLRVLTELYRKEKKENFAKFTQVYTIAKRNAKPQESIFPFEDFYTVVAEVYDKNITDIEISTLYRDSYIAGGASISCDSILLTFSESPFWIRYLRLKGQNTEPKYDFRGDIDQSDERGKECALVYA